MAHRLGQALLATGWVVIVTAIAACEVDANVIRLSNPGDDGGADGVAGTGGATGTAGASGSAGSGGSVNPCGTPERYQSLATTIEEQRTSQGVTSMAAAVIEGGELCWSQGFGQRTSYPVDKFVAPRTLFQAGSLQLTAIAIFQLVDEGKINLDDSVQTYLPELLVRGSASWAQQATVRDLLASRSGLSHEWEPSASLGSGDDAIETYFLSSAFQEEVYQEYPPGLLHQRSNVSASVLGWMVERVSGMAYSDYIRQRILDPLGMTRTFFLDSEIQADGDFVLGAYDDGLKRPAYGLFTSVVEEAKLVQFLLRGNPQILSPQSMEALSAEASELSDVYGHEWWLTLASVVASNGLWLQDGFAAVEIPHFESLSYWRHQTFIHTVPSDGLALVMLTSGGLDASGIVRKVYEDLVGVSVPAASFSPCGAGEYSKFLGVYRTPSISEPIRLSMELGELKMIREGTAENCVLSPEWPRVFTCEGDWLLHDGQSVTVDVDQNGLGQFIVTGWWVATRVPDSDAGTGDASPE